MFEKLGTLMRRLAAAGAPHLGDTMERLETAEALEACLHQSESQPVLLFKHSTRCPISSGALREVEAYLAQAGDDAVPVYVNLVVEHRSVSNEIASVLGVQHASPQAFLVVNRAARWHKSHGAIQADAIRRAVVESG